MFATTGRIGRVCALVFLLASPVVAQVFSVITNHADIDTVAATAWSNTSLARIVPPGPNPWRNDLGLIGFSDSFSTEGLAALTQSGTTIWPLELIETTNDEPRIRFYFNATGGLFRTVSAPADYARPWVTNVYGSPGAWLSGTNLEAWYAERDPAHQHVVLTLIATSSLPAYLAVLSNQAACSEAGGTNVSLLALYSNDIAFVQAACSDGVGRVLLHAPANVASLDWFGTADLSATNAWALLANLAHAGDPLSLSWSATGSNVWNCAAGDGALDRDGDGLTDARELLLSHTDPQSADSDGDGLGDGQEFLQYASNPHRTDSAGDGLNDAWKVANNLDPNSALDPQALAPNGLIYAQLSVLGARIDAPVVDLGANGAAIEYRAQENERSKFTGAPEFLWEQQAATTMVRRYFLTENNLGLTDKMNIMGCIPATPWVTEHYLGGGDASPCPNSTNWVVCHADTFTRWDPWLLSGDWERGTYCSKVCAGDPTYTPGSDSGYLTSPDFASGWLGLADVTNGMMSMNDLQVLNASNRSELTSGGVVLSERTNEHTLQQLEAMTRASLDDGLPMTQIGWTNRARTAPPAPWVRQGVHEVLSLHDFTAEHYVSPDEVTCRMRRLNYRFCVTNSITGVVYRATVALVFTPTNQGATGIVVEVRHHTVVGNGQTQFLPSADEGIVEPPTNKGTISVQPFAVRLYRDGTNISWRLSDVNGGQRLFVSARVEPTNIPVTAFQWTPGTNFIHGYEFRLERGGPEPFSTADLSNKYLTLYGTRSETAMLRHVSVVAGEWPVAVAMRFNVQLPTAEVSTRLTTQSPPIQVTTDYDQLYLRPGEPSNPGVKWTATNVLVPSFGNGSVGYLQLVESTRYWRHKTNGLYERKSSGTEFMLDCQVETGPIYDGHTKQFTPLETGHIIRADSPGLPATSNCYLSVDERFRTYLIYRPDDEDSIWVPIRQATWEWRASATNASDPDSIVDWIVTSNANLTASAWSAPGELPAWSNLIVNSPWTVVSP